MITLKDICINRPVGTKENKKLIFKIADDLNKAQLNTIFLPIKSHIWEHEDAYLEVNKERINLNTAQFSKKCEGIAVITIITTLVELKKNDIENKIVVIAKDLASRPLMAKNYPFYYPDEDKEIIELLENKKPLAIIALTGSDTNSGMRPFALFNDGNFNIPNTYLEEGLYEKFKNYEGLTAKIRINSKTAEKETYQLVAKKGTAKETIVLAAHMDTQYNTEGALDNGGGVLLLTNLAKRINNANYSYDFVFFNGEESYEASGELAYLDYLAKTNTSVSYFINIDGACHVGSKTAVSVYNLDENQTKQVTEKITTSKNILLGTPWYSGDHTMFAFKGTKCLALTSSDIFEGGLCHTHTPLDTISEVDLITLKDTEDFLVSFISKL